MTPDEIVCESWSLAPLNGGLLLLACSSAFVDFVADAIATPPERGRYFELTAGPLANAARCAPHLRAELLSIVRALDAQAGWS